MSIIKVSETRMKLLSKLDAGVSIKPGQIIYLTSGEHSLYTIDGVFLVQKAFDPEQKIVEWEEYFADQIKLRGEWAARRLLAIASSSIGGRTWLYNAMEKAVPLRECFPTWLIKEGYIVEIEACGN